MTSDSQDPSNSQRFQDEDNAPIDGYAPLSMLAVGALVFALLTPASLVFNVLSLFSVVPFVMAILALRGIRRANHPMKGKNLALIAIALSVFSMTSSLSAHTLTRRHLTAEADSRFHEWHGYVLEEKYYEAFELTRQYVDRQLPGIDLADVYENAQVNLEGDGIGAPQRPVALYVDEPTQVVEEFNVFFNSEPASVLIRHPDDLTFHLVRCEEIEHGRPDTTVTLVYEAEYPDGGVLRRFRFVAEMMRSRYKGGEYHWRLDELYMLRRDD